MEYGMRVMERAGYSAAKVKRAIFQPTHYDHEINPGAETPAYTPFDPTLVYQDWARTKPYRRPTGSGGASSSNIIISVETDRPRPKWTRRKWSGS